MISPLAGKPVTPDMLENIPRLVTAYYVDKPDARDPAQKVAFGTSGHRGSSLKCSFNEDHILAVTQAICDYRKKAGVDGPLFIGIDTHGLSEPAYASALEVLAANDVEVMVDVAQGYTPTPSISLAILMHNRDRNTGLADGIVITPSHNPPADGGFKYNPPNGGPADTDVTGVVEAHANELLLKGLSGVKRVSYRQAEKAAKKFDFLDLYTRELSSVIDLDLIRASGIKAAVDPLGGAGAAYWERLIADYNLPIELTRKTVDPSFAFMCADRDGKIRMDCSSPYAMAGLLALRDRFDLAFANDTDHDRHGIVTPRGLMNPNHYLAVAIEYLFSTRENWGKNVQVGKTLVSSSMIDRVVAKLGRELIEVPVGFKWFVDGLLAGTLGFGGEESAGASFLRKDGSVWTTDKDGIILALLSAEILARTKKNPQEHYDALTKEFGTPFYDRIDAPANAEQKAQLKKLSPAQVKASELAGEPILSKVTKASGNNQSIGGLKVSTENGWFAARPSGTEDVYKIYAESFKGEDHLRRIQEEAREIVTAVVSPTVSSV